jgi:hypothetical protein
MTPLVKSVLQSRRNLCQLIIMAVLLALGVNLIASWFAGQFSDMTWVIWLVGLLLIIATILYMVHFLTQESFVSYEFEAALIFNLGEKAHVEIDGYDFSESFDQKLNALFVENKAFKTAWELERVFSTQAKKPASKETKDESDNTGKKKEEVSYFTIMRVDAEEEEESTPQRSILIETAEFCLLEFLSLHLSAYFGQTPHNKARIVTIEREHIPDILLENRVLSLLTTPIEDRQIFVKSGINKHPPQGEVYDIFGSDGTVYKRFYLILPKGTGITRPQPGVIRLEHRHFVLEIGCFFHGFNLNLPRYFEELYIGSDSKEIAPRKLDISVSAQLRKSSLALITGWIYYQWIDSFMEYIESHVSFEAFLERIDWQSVSTRIRASMILEHRRKQQKVQQNVGQVPSEGTPTDELST